MQIAVIYITNPSEAAAQALAEKLVDQKLVACSNIFPITSMYWWQGAIEKDGEWVAIVKTSIENWAKVKQAVEQLHSYEVPCILKFEVEANEAYGNWILESIL